MKARASREGTAAKMRGLSGRLPGLGQGPRGDDGGAPAGVSDLFRVDVDEDDQIHSLTLEVFGDAPADLPRTPDDGPGVGGEGAKPEVVGFGPEKNFDGVPTVPAREPVRAFAPGEEDERDFGKAPAGEVEPEPEVVVFGPSEVFLAVYRRQVLSAHDHRGVGQGAFDVDLPGDVIGGEGAVEPGLVDPEALSDVRAGEAADEAPPAGEKGADTAVAPGDLFEERWGVVFGSVVYGNDFKGFEALPEKALQGLREGGCPVVDR